MDELTRKLKDCGRSKIWLADYLGISRSTVSHWKPSNVKYQIALLYADTEVKLMGYHQLKELLGKMK